MIEFKLYPEEKRSVARLYRSFAKDILKLDILSLDIFEQERVNQYHKLRKCLADCDNFDFLLESLIDRGEQLSFKRMAEFELVSSTLENNAFIFLISGQSLTNRIVAACKKRELPIELIYRLRECIWVFNIFCTDDIAV